MTSYFHVSALSGRTKYISYMWRTIFCIKTNTRSASDMEGPELSDNVLKAMEWAKY